MKPGLYQKHSVQKVDSRLSHASVLLFSLAFLCSSTWSTFSAEASESEGDNVRLGKLSQLKSSHLDFGTSFSTQDGSRLGTTRLSIVAPKREQNHKQTVATNSDISGKQNGSNPAQIDDPVSSDCNAKRNEVLRRHSSTTATPARSTTTSLPAGLQRLQAKNHASLATVPSSIVLNETLANNFDGEHVPRCRPDGSFEPVQCHKIGYCWCVNKFGQAIKNSAVMSGDEPFCEPAMYESDSNDFLVVAGISAQRMRNFLKQSGSSVESTTPNGHINFEASESSTEASEAEAHQQVESGKRAGSVEPTMPLIPNNCEASRINARERAVKFVNDSIWVPECDKGNSKLYAERQCHRVRVCWCVDQSSGLPLRTSDQLVARADHSNCSEIKRLVELASESIGGRSSKAQLAFYRGSSEFCDADKRIEFVVSLNNQFRQQINEYMRQNPSSPVPPDVSSSNPLAISELQVSRWKFSLMDKDLDGRLGDREWSKFKNNFKLVDKADDLDNPSKLQKSPYFSLTPLLIVRSQRKCWRDFLEICGNGDLLVDESISLSRWLTCTELPPKSLYEEQQNRRHGLASLENTYAHSREAAIVRSKKKNPFLGILKPD